jgi:hypothetical protein
MASYYNTSMGTPVTQFEPPHNHLLRTNWQSLGQLRLRAGSNPDGTIKGWLMDALADFSLPGDLISRLLASIEEATARVLSPGSIEGQFEYLEIVVLAPPKQASKGHNWGFFRVERASTDSLSESAQGHCVEYYLYLDKKTGE